MSMNLVTIARLIDTLDEVTALAREVQAEIKACDDVDTLHRRTYPYYRNPKLTATLRRRSMDLTRALAELRRS